DYTEVIRLDSNEFEAHYCRGLAYSKKGDLDRAAGDFLKAIHLGCDRREALPIFQNLSNIYSSTKAYDKAITDFTEVIRLYPKNKLGYYWRGWAFNWKGEYGKAIADFSEAIARDPNEPDVFSSRGGIYYALQEYDKAIADYSEVLRLDPKKAEN